MVKSKKDEIDKESETSEELEEKPVKERKEKKAIRKRKSKKEKENPIARAIRLTVESGKVDFGARVGLKNSLLGKAKLIVIASRSPIELIEDITYYSKLSNIPLLVFEGTGVELGSICGKPYVVSVLSIYDVGSSDIMKLAKKT